VTRGLPLPHVPHTHHRICAGRNATAGPTFAAATPQLATSTELGPSWQRPSPFPEDPSSAACGATFPQPPSYRHHIRPPQAMGLPHLLGQPIASCHSPRCSVKLTRALGDRCRGRVVAAHSGPPRRLRSMPRQPSPTRVIRSPSLSLGAAGSALTGSHRSGERGCPDRSALGGPGESRTTHRRRHLHPDATSTPGSAPRLEGEPPR
jgi:hypothetical protein